MWFGWAQPEYSVALNSYNYSNVTCKSYLQAYLRALEELLESIFVLIEVLILMVKIKVCD